MPKQEKSAFLNEVRDKIGATPLEYLHPQNIADYCGGYWLKAINQCVVNNFVFSRIAIRSHGVV